MGADSFSNVSEGKTAQEAFNRAVEQAQYEHGHGGYTGTIAEKHSFHMIDIAGEAEKLIREFTKRREYCTIAKQKKLRTEIKEHEKAKQSDLSEREWDRWSRRSLELSNLRVNCNRNWVDGKWVDETLAEACKRTRQQIAEHLKNLRSKRKKAETVGRLIDVNKFDKWGPAGCIQIGKRKFLFVGMASS